MQNWSFLRRWGLLQTGSNRLFVRPCYHHELFQDCQITLLFLVCVQARLLLPLVAPRSDKNCPVHCGFITDTFCYVLFAYLNTWKYAVVELSLRSPAALISCRRFGGSVRVEFDVFFVSYT
jgi:hypothetical protein